MGLIKINSAADMLFEHWCNQGIFPGNDFGTEKFQGLIDKLFSFEEFIYLYSKANGMSNKYPDEYDTEGFLFYPAGNIEFFLHDSEILILGDYLNKCWWYGVRILSEESYEILLIEGKGMYTFISNSLSEFIVMYVNNEELIYPMHNI